jgi:hypothetical protein
MQAKDRNVPENNKIDDTGNKQKIKPAVPGKILPSVFR